MCAKQKTRFRETPRGLRYDRHPPWNIIPVAKPDSQQASSPMNRGRIRYRKKAVLREP